MSKYRITNCRTGADFGLFEGETAEAAFGAMVEDAGGSATDCEGTPCEGTLADWIIEEVCEEDAMKVDLWKITARYPLDVGSHLRTSYSLFEPFAHDAVRSEGPESYVVPAGFAVRRDKLGTPHFYEDGQDQPSDLFDAGECPAILRANGSTVLLTELAPQRPPQNLGLFLVCALLALCLAQPAAAAQAPRLGVNVNTATEQQLAYLPGVGEVIAQRIIAARGGERGQHYFGSVQDLCSRVKGLGGGKCRDIAPYVLVGRGPTTATGALPKLPRIVSYPACRTEDGPAPCIWDCQTRGNHTCGAGASRYVLLTPED